jgi:hypothetical protein
MVIVTLKELLLKEGFAKTANGLRWTLENQPSSLLHVDN